MPRRVAEEAQGRLDAARRTIVAPRVAGSQARSRLDRGILHQPHAEVPLLVVGHFVRDEQLFPRERERARSQEALAEHAGRVPSAVPVPDHHEVARAVERHVRTARIALVAARERVDLEVATLRIPGAVEAPREDAEAAAVLAPAAPGHDEVAGAVRSHGREVLPVPGVGVHLELSAERVAGAVEPPSEHIFVRALPCPDDDEVPRPVECNLGIGHVVGTRIVHLEFAALAIAGAVVALHPCWGRR